MGKVRENQATEADCWMNARGNVAEMVIDELAVIQEQCGKRRGASDKAVPGECATFYFKPQDF